MTQRDSAARSESTRNEKLRDKQCTPRDWEIGREIGIDSDREIGREIGIDVANVLDQFTCCHEGMVKVTGNVSVFECKFFSRTFLVISVL